MTTTTPLTVEQQTAMYFALGNDWRMRILGLLRQHNGDYSVNDIVADFEREYGFDEAISQGNVSHHLGILLRVGLIEIHHRSQYATRRQAYYAVNANAFTALVVALDKWRA